MLTKQIVKYRIQKNKHLLEELGVNDIGLFGSFVREEHTESSDIDFLVNYREGYESFDNFMKLTYFLDDLFKELKVDVVTLKGLSPYIGPQILNEVEYV